MVNLILISIAIFVIWHTSKLCAMVCFMGRTEIPQAICRQHVTKFDIIYDLSIVSDDTCQSNTAAVEIQNCKTIDNNSE